MRISSLLAASSLTLLLGACAGVLNEQTPEPPVRPATEEVTPTLEPDPETDMLEPGDVPAAPAPEASTGSALPERLLDNGLLEIGNAKAPHILLIYTNHGCAYCASVTRELLPRLRQDFIDPGMLRVQIAVVPLQKYPNSTVEAAALFCAARQGRGSALHWELFGLNPRTQQAIYEISSSLKIDQAALEQCMNSNPPAPSLDPGVQLIPAFALGDKKLTGLPSYADLRAWIETGMRSAR